MNDLDEMVQREFLDMADGFTKAWVALVSRWPNHAKALATAFLGNAIGIADTFGVDVEGFLAQLRKTHPKPAPLVRNPRASS